MIEGFFFEFKIFFQDLIAMGRKYQWYFFRVFNAFWEFDLFGVLIFGPGIFGGFVGSPGNLFGFDLSPH